jgi:asparagine synthase (glutamine-hydrolysing)
MCGIAAAIGTEQPTQIVEAMLRVLRHRGDCDDPVDEVSGLGAIGCRRLRILDPSRAVQPYWSSDGSTAVVLNGQIYNFRELRSELERLGATFTSDCDTEVAANALAVWGPDAPGRFEGMFAIVALQPGHKTWLVARDPMGIKPLYMSTSLGGTVIASEPKALCATPGSAPILPVQPGATIVNGVPYRPPPSQRSSGSRGDLGSLLEQAVLDRIPEEMPFGVMFGGGIDSTLVLHLARSRRADAIPYLITNDWGVDRPYALEYCSKTGTELREVPFDSAQLFDLIRTVVRACESFEPNMIRNAVFSYLLGEAIAADGLRIALCGEGADELFAGYPEVAYSGSDIIARRDDFLADLHRTQLQRVDRCTMAHSVETRVPFLDSAVIAYAKDLRADELVGVVGGQVRGKLPLRELYLRNPALPAIIGTREKVPLVEGAGMGTNEPGGPFAENAANLVSDADMRRFAGVRAKYDISTKEELLYLLTLEEELGLERLSFLTPRPRVNRSGAKA